MPTEATATDGLNLTRDGAQRRDRALDAPTLRRMIEALAELPGNAAGQRLFGVSALHPLLDRDGPVGALAASVLGEASRPVRAILFDKTSRTNWALGWHQDRVIAVAERVEIEGFGPWSRKQGVLHVAPPFPVLERMATLRVHLDDVAADNAPLLVAPGSHRIGRIAQNDVSDVVRRCGAVACLATAGDVWAYATPILHASEAAKVQGRRRVLQVDYAAEDLPSGLRWLGI